MIPDFGRFDESRRLHYQALAAWQNTAPEGGFPTTAEFDPATIDFLMEKSFVIDVTDGFEKPLIIYSGADIDEACGHAVTGKLATELQGDTVFFHLADHYVEVIANRCPISFEAEYHTRESLNRKFRGILLPVSDGGAEVEKIVGVLNWTDQDGAG